MIAERLAKDFDKVLIVVCGPRPDKVTTQDIDPVYRATMVDLAFHDLPKVEIDNSDLEHAVFTRTHELQSRYESQGELWHVIGSDLATGGGKQQSFIHRVWEEGVRLWQELNFIVVKRPGYDLAPDDLPPRHVFIELAAPGSSSGIRDDLFHRRDVHDRVDPAVLEYIERYGLYRGRIPNRTTRWCPGQPRAILIADERNARARGWKEHFRAFEVTEKPNCVIVLGGDGTMLRAIRKYSSLRVPFLGLNAGHLGFLLNNSDQFLENTFPPPEMILRQLPLLLVELFDESGRYAKEYAFNDAWVERSTSQTAWLELSVSGNVRIPKLACDGVLLATPSGSTAYAMAMGASPLLADAGLARRRLERDESRGLEVGVARAGIDHRVAQSRPGQASRARARRRPHARARGRLPRALKPHHDGRARLPAQPRHRGENRQRAVPARPALNLPQREGLGGG
jgi:NAD+ kinase